MKPSRDPDDVSTAVAVADHMARPVGSGRIVAIDVARGVALVAMTIYHFSWDLSFFGWLDAELVGARPWVLFARTIATSFLALVGVSLVLAHGNGIRWKGFSVRLAQVAAGALGISIVTYFFVPGGFIFFGILHAIALFSLFALPFVRAPWWLTGMAAAFVFMVGNTWTAPVFQSPLLWWVGLMPNPPVSNDFVPVFPFFAATLAGVALTQLAIDRDWLDRLRSIGATRASARPLAFIGRHSLVYYLIHQPILFALIAAFNMVSGGPDLTERTLKLWDRECRAVQSVPFCTAYVECAGKRLKAADLFGAVSRGTLDERQTRQLDALLQACAADARAG